MNSASRKSFAAPAAVPEPPGTLLVCDRPNGALAALPEMLEALGFPCDYAVDAHEDPADVPEPLLLLIPAELPGGPTGELFRRLRRRYPRPPVVAVAETRSFANAMAFWRAGAADYLSLPLDPDETVARLQPLLDAARARHAAAAVEPVEVDVEWDRAAPPPETPAEAAADSDGDDLLSSMREWLATAPPEPEGPPTPAEPDGSTPESRAPVSTPAGDKEGQVPSSIPPNRASESDKADKVDKADDDDDVLARLSRLDDLLSWLTAMPCGVVVIASDGAGVYANPAALSLLGAADAAGAARLLGAGWAELAPTRANGRVVEARARPAAQALRDKSVRGMAVRVARPSDGRRLWLRCDCAPWRDRGRWAGVVATLVNITDEFVRSSGDRAQLSGPVQGSPS